MQENSHPRWTVRPKNKHWINSNIEELLNRKKQTFREHDREKLRLTQQQLKKSLSQAKQDYRWKVEGKLRNNDTREVWRGIRTITGYGSSQATEGGVEKANQLNQFFNRFDTSPAAGPVTLPAPIPPPPPSTPNPPSLAATAHPPRADGAPLSLGQLMRQAAEHLGSTPRTPAAATVSLPLALTMDEVRTELRRLRPHKAAGPDGVCPRLLKDCAAQLAVPLQ